MQLNDWIMMFFSKDHGKELIRFILKEYKEVFQAKLQGHGEGEPALHTRLVFDESVVEMLYVSTE